ncbi:MAG: YIP1 family protein [Mangrovicoccus sp.]|nr:YIP1 family protein [Mangrovicoccus sp.]
MSVTLDILETYRAPRRVLRRQLAGPEHEGRLLVYLMLACALIFVSQWPRLAREAHLDPSVPLDARLGGALLAWIMIAPLLFYALAGISHLLAWLFGGKGRGYGGRLALFWALLAVSPLWLLYGLASGMLGAGTQLTMIGFPLFAAFMLFWALGWHQAYWRNPVECADGTP